MARESLSGVEDRAERLMNTGQFTEARKAYLCMLEGEHKLINQVVFLSNIMTCYAKENDTVNAIKTGEQALDIIDTHKLKGVSGSDGDKAAIIRGHIRGKLMQLRNTNSSLWDELIYFCASYIAAAFIGAAIGINIHFDYKPENTTPLALRCPDARYLVAPLCGYIGQYLFYGVLRLFGGMFSCVIGLAAAAGIWFLFRDLAIPQVFIATIFLVLPILVIWLRSREKTKTVGHGI